MITRLAGPSSRGLALALVLTVVAPTLGLLPPGSAWSPAAHAVEFPTDGSPAGWGLQTNGPSADPDLGDAYTSTAGDGQDHYLTITVPCGWPAGTPIHVDLYSPEVNDDQVAPTDVGDLEEPSSLSTTVFSLHGPYPTRQAAEAVDRSTVPGDVVHVQQYPAVPDSGPDPTWVRFVTLPGSACGTYLLRSGFVDSTATDQNGWRVRVGADGGAGAGAALDSDPDGLVGTDDEIVVGVLESTFQHDGGSGSCLDLFEWVDHDPASPHVQLHNFDLDSAGSVDYADAAGTPQTPSTVSGSAAWNGSIDATRGGDLVDVAPTEEGWWRITTCAGDHDQFIQEGQASVVAYIEQPGEPELTVLKSGPVSATIGEAFAYTIAVTNDAAATSAAVNVELTDVLPAGVSLGSCGWDDGAGSCTEAGGTVTAVRRSVHAGATRTLAITVTAAPGATSPFVNDATVAFTDAVDNAYPPVTSNTVTTSVLSAARSGDVCWAVADGGDQLVRYDLATGAETDVGDLGVIDVEGLAYDVRTGTLYAANTNVLGTISQTDGTFTPVVSGNTLAPATDVDGLAFHPFTGVLYGTNQIGGKDQLYTIDPATGTVTSGPITVDAADSLPGLDDVDDLAISPVTGRAYAIANSPSGGDRLVEVSLDPATAGAVVDLGAVQDGSGTPVEDVEGLSFDATGTLYATTGTAAAFDNQLFSFGTEPFGPGPAVVTLVHVFTTPAANDYEALACLTAAGNTISGTLFQDRDGSGTLTTGDTADRAGVAVTLRRPTGEVLTTTQTAADGTYAFTFPATGAFEVVLDTSDPSFSGQAVTPDDVVTVDFGTTFGESRVVDFWYRWGRIAGIAWLDLDHDGVRDGADPAITDGSVTLELWMETNGLPGLQTDPAIGDLRLVAAVAADPAGAYAFGDLPAGTYHVVAADPSRDFTLQDAAPTLDSDVDEATGVSDPVVLAAGEHVTDLDAGVWDDGSIAVRVFEDVDGDALLDAGDALLDGVPVTLYEDTNANGTLDPKKDAVLAVALTGAGTEPAGTVTFAGLDPGTYLTDVDESGLGLATPTLSTGNDPAAHTVVSGTAASMDVGYYDPVFLGDLVWEDLDADGVHEPALGESGLADAIVRLRDDAGALVASVTTGPDGRYGFGPLAPGTYAIEVVPPATYTLSPQGQGGDAAFDSDVDPSTGSTGLVAYPSGTDTAAIDAGAFSAATISGRVWHDRDADSLDEPTDPTAPEPGLGGLTVSLYDDTGALLATTTTSSDATTLGDYAFPGLDPGTYIVEVDAGTRTFSAQAGDSDVDPVDGRATVTVVSGQDLTGLDAGVYDPLHLSGRLWLDDDGDGQQAAGATEAGIAGRSVTITGPGAGSPYTVVTDADGQWSTSALGVDLAPGTYTVSYPDVSATSVFTRRDVGSDATDSDVDAAGDLTVTLLSGGTADVDAGTFEPVTVGDRVWQDVDGDGVQGALEPGIGDVTVRLHHPSDLSPAAALATVTTDSTGAYAFTGRSPGSYVVVVELPGAFVPTVADVGGDDTVDSDVSRSVPTATSATSATVTVTSGVDDRTIDAGLYEATSVEGRVFDDQDGDGVDEGEPGWTTVDVTLLSDHDRDGVYTVVSTAITASDGAYAFPGLRPGPYRIVVDTADLPADAVLTTANQPLDVTLASGQALTEQDIGYRQPATIAGLVFEDVDGDADPAGDPVLTGVPVELRSADGTVLDTTTTDGNGEFTFDLLVPATYEIHVIEPARHLLTTADDPVTVTVVPSDVVDLAFGYQRYAPALTLTPDGARRVEVGPSLAVEVTYPHTVTNTGNVTDTYDLTVSGASWPVVLIRDDDGDGIRDAGETSVVSVTPALAPGASFELFAVVTVPAGTARGSADTLTLTATSRVGPEDPTAPPITAAATDTTTVVAPVVDVDKTSSLAGAPAVPGQRVTHTVVVTNVGTDAAVAPATGLVLDDVLADPTHGSIDAATVTIDGVLQPDPTTFPLSLGTLAPGSTVRVTVEVVLARPIADGTVVTDIATVTVGNPQLYDASDTPVASVTATVSEVVASEPVPQLQVSATPATGTIVDPGTVITYRATVSNRADATDTWRDVVGSHDLPLVGARYVPGSARIGTVSVPDGPGGTNPFDPANGGAVLGDLAPGDSVTIAVDVAVDDPVADGTTLSDLVSADGSNGGPLFGALTHTVEVDPRVSLTPDGARTVEPGISVVYGHLLANTGDVTDTYDLVVDSDTGFAVRLVDDLDGDGALDVGEPAITVSRTLAPGEVQRLLVVVDVPSAAPGGTIDTVTVVATSRFTSAVTAQAFDVTTVVAGELEIVKTAAPGSSAINPGQVITYTVEVRNVGGAPVPGVVVIDDTPSGATYRSGTTRLDGVPVPDAPGADPNPLADVNGGLLLGDLAPGASRLVSFDVQVRSTLPDRTLLVNVATATSTSGLSVDDSVSQLVTASPVLDVRKSASPVQGAVAPGTVLTYTITLGNVGNVAATGVRIEDQVPSRTTYVRGSTTLDGQPVADSSSSPEAPLAPENGGVLLGRVEPGAPVRTITFRVRVDDPLPDGTVITNVARATSLEGVSASTTPVRHTVRVMPGVSLTPDNGTTSESPGLAVHPHVATNTGTGTDTMLLSASSSQGWPVLLYRDDDGDAVWDLDEGTVISSTGPLAPGATMRLFAVVDVPAGIAADTVDVTTVRATSTVDGGVSATAVDATTVVTPALELVKAAQPSGDQINAGQVLTYQLLVTNRGRADAVDALITDATPAGTAYVPGSARIDGAVVPDGINGDGNPFSPANSGHVLATVPARTTVTLRFDVLVDAAATVGTVITNTATLEEAGGVPVTSTRTHTVSNGPVLDVTKTAQPDPGTTTLTAGDVVTYTVVVRNAGLLAATAVRITDDTPVNTDYVTDSATVAGVPVADGVADPNPFGSATGGYPVGDLAPGASVNATFQVVVLDSVGDHDQVRNVAVAASGDGASAASAPVVHDIDVAPAVTLVPDRTRDVVPGTTVTLAHTLTNVGDVPDGYDLSAASGRGWPTRVFHDVDGDGAVGAGDVEVATSGLLQPGDDLGLLVTVDVPSDAVAGITGDVVIRAWSVEDQAVWATATDTLTVVQDALTLVKTASPATVRPGDVATYTLTASNTGGAPVADVRLFDPAPAGTTYVRRSVQRDGVAVPDTPDGDSPLAGGLLLGELGPGDTVVVTFRVTVDAEPDRTVVVNAAELVAPGRASVRAGTVQPYDTERGLDITAGTVREVAPGATAAYAHTVTNTGDLADEVAIAATSSSGLDVRIVHDLDGDGAADAGEPELLDAVVLPAGGTIDVVVLVEVPPNAPAGLRDDLLVTATSVDNAAIAASATDTTVVITAVLQVVKASQPQTTTEPGSLVRFGIAVTNTGTEPARDVTVVDPIPAGTAYVPGTTTLDGVSVADVDDRSAVDPSGPGLPIGDLAPGASSVVLFSVRVNDDVVPGAVLTNVAEARSPDTGPVPSTPVALTVGGTTQLDIRKTATPTGQVPPGGTLRWTVTVTNVGSVAVPNVLLTDVLPPELVYMPGSTTVDGTSVGDGVAAGTPVGIGGLEPGQVRTIVFDTTVGDVADGTVLHNTASATNATTGTSVLSNTATVVVDHDAGGLPETGFGVGRTLTAAAVALGSGWALLYVVRPERRPRPVMLHRSR